MEKEQHSASPLDIPVRDRWHGHHIWCNLAGSRPVSECHQCKRLFSTYPTDGLEASDLLSKHFPDAVTRTTHNV